MVFATVPAAPPTAKNHRATSWPPPISAKVPYFAGSRLSATAFCRVLEAASSMMERPENRRQHPATPSRRLSTPVLPEVRVGERPSAGVELSRFAVAGHSSTPADLTTRLTAHSAHRARRYGAREAPLEHQGEHYTIPYRGPGATGLGKPLRSILHGRQIPIYIAAIGPKSVEQAAEIADGWLPVWYSPYWTKFYREALAAGFRRAGGGKSLASFDVAPGVTVIPGDDVQACLDFVKPMLALYIGGMARQELLQRPRVPLRLRSGGEEGAGPLPRRQEGRGDGRGAERARRRGVAGGPAGPHPRPARGVARVGGDDAHLRHAAGGGDADARRGGG